MKTKCPLWIHVCERRLARVLNRELFADDRLICHCAYSYQQQWNSQDRRSRSRLVDLQGNVDGCSRLKHGRSMVRNASKNCLEKIEALCRNVALVEGKVAVRIGGYGRDPLHALPRDKQVYLLARHRIVSGSVQHLALDLGFRPQSCREECGRHCSASETLD